MTKIIAFTGLAGCGKSILARYLQVECDKINKHSAILRFSDPIKSFARRLGWKGEKDAKGRRLLQLLGTEIGRNCIDPEIWVKRWEIEFKRISQVSELIIVDDLRFDNEAKTVHELNGTIIKIIGREDERTDKSHASELGITQSYCDKVFFNTSDLENLKEEAYALARGL